MAGEGSDGTQAARVPTGIPGLDAILRGGLLRGGVYIVAGTPGAGKTILANQIGFHHLANGGRVLYVTLLAENHDRMIAHVGRLSFFDEGAIPEALSYVSGFGTLEQGGLNGLRDLLWREMRRLDASLLVLDGILAVEEVSPSDREFRKFIHELQTHANLQRWTGLLLTSSEPGDVRPEHTMVDGVIALSDVMAGAHRQRELELRKLRGAGTIRGPHAFRITDDGITLFPRLEGLLANPPETEPAGEVRVSTGIDELDAMVGGGIPRGGMSLVLGPSGIGKTAIGLHYLSRSSEAEPGLMFGFYETPQQLLLKARLLGLDLDGPAARGHLEFLWQPPTERILDELGHRLLEAVRRRGVRRLFVDGLPGFKEAMARPDREIPFFAALNNELRVQGATTLYTMETHDLLGAEILEPQTGISALTQNTILLRFVEMEGRLRRLLAVVKVRESDHDPSLRHFEITGRGVVVGPAADRGEALLSGFARRTARWFGLPGRFRPTSSR
jgi:circadian clock protein KaiC